jgi:ribose-phosphate pyrophosphokinase
MYLVIGEDNFSKEIADKLNAEFIKVNSFVFPDSEIKPVIENEDKIKGKKVLLVLRANRFKPSISDCLMKIYFICKTLHGKAEEINLFLPYMFYSRQDKKFLPGEPESLSDIADLYEGLGIKNIFTINSHLYGKENPLQNYFKKIKIHDISPSRLFAEYLKAKNLKNSVVLGPGTGPAVMVKELSRMLNTSYECLEKERDHKTQEIFMKPPKSNLKDRDVIIYDDVAASGGTIAPAFELAKKFNPNRIFIVLSHLVTKNGIEKLYNLNSSEIITTDSFVSEEPIKFTELSLATLVDNHFK